MIAQVFGIGAMISLFLIYQQKSRKGILICKLSADVFWIAHYFCLGAVAGMIPNFVGSYIGILNESISILSILLYFFKTYREGKHYES